MPVTIVKLTPVNGSFAHVGYNYFPRHRLATMHSLRGHRDFHANRGLIKFTDALSVSITSAWNGSRPVAVTTLSHQRSNCSYK
jgi:hypothetical protein